MADTMIHPLAWLCLVADDRATTDEDYDMVRRMLPWQPAAVVILFRRRQHG